VNLEFDTIGVSLNEFTRVILTSLIVKKSSWGISTSGFEVALLLSPLKNKRICYDPIIYFSQGLNALDISAVGSICEFLKSNEHWIDAMSALSILTSVRMPTEL